MKRSVLVAAVLLGCIATINVCLSQTSQPQEADIALLLKQAADLKGDDYIQARDKLLESAKTQGARDELADIAKDSKAGNNTRLLAELCLLRLKDDSAVKAFYNDLEHIVVSISANERVWTVHLPAPDYLRKMHPATFLGLRKNKREPSQKTGLILSQHEKSVQRLLKCNEALLAECLIWHTDATLQKAIISSQSEKTKKENSKVKPVPGWRPEYTGWVGQTCASWFLVVKADMKSVGILELWGKRDDGTRQLAMEYFKRWFIYDKQLAMPVRREAILAYARLGGKDTLEFLESEKEKSPEKDIRDAADEAIRYLKETSSKSATTTKPAK